jgi:hypothetical protein
MTIRRLLLLLVLPAIAYADAAPRPLAKGDRVLGNFGGNAYWYPATVVGLDGDRYELRYDDGSTETVARSATRPLAFTKDQPVECQLVGDDWSGLKVTAVNGGQLGVVGNDGAAKTSPLAKCRTTEVPPDPEEVRRKAEAKRAEEEAAAKAATEHQRQLDEETRKQEEAVKQLHGTLDKLANSPRIDEDKVNCKKQDEITDDEMNKHNDNPLQAVADKAATMCTVVQHMYQESKPGSGPPKASKVAGLSRDTVLTLSTQYWADSDDAKFVKVLGARVTGSGWSNLYMSDVKGVVSSRVAEVVHTISYRNKCFLVYGQVKQKNLNHPYGYKPPAWSTPEMTGGASETIDCKKAKF